jgi:GNAT superfamily N-acetyltransferase
MSPDKAATIHVRSLEPDDWPNVETLFGDNGACGGCWCMWWRVPRGGKLWEQNKGEPNRRALRELIKSGSVHAGIAFEESTPVGWCCFGPRDDFPRLDRTRAFSISNESGTWAVVCFFIHRDYRRRGVAGLLLEHALVEARSAGAARIQAAPAPDRWQKGKGIPPAFAYTGTESLYRTAGFEKISPPEQSRPVYELPIT